MNTANYTSFCLASTQATVDTTGQFQNISAQNFLSKLKSCEIGKKDGSHYLRTTLKSQNGYVLPRKDTNTDSLANILIIDCDKRISTTENHEIEGAPPPYLVSEILCKHNISHIIYGSYSHYVGNKGNRYRIVLFTDKPYNKDHLDSTLENLISIINSNLEVEHLVNSKENSTWSQPWFYPRKPANSTIDDLYIECLDGDLTPVVEPVPIPAVTHIHEYKKFSFQTNQISPIQAFNEQNVISDLLIHYGYKKVYSAKDHEKWLSPESKSGIAGITVKRDKFYSHHNDVFNDGYWHDAFDLMKLCEGLSELDAIKKAAQMTNAPDGRTVDEFNKTQGNKENHSEHDSTLKISFNEYKPFSDDLLPVEHVPYDALPETMGAFIKEHSTIRGCPPDYILVSLLARLGCVFSGKIKIAMTKNTNWHASPNFFWMMVGNPSSGKSNAFSLTNKPIQSLEEQARKQYKEAFKLYKDKYDLLERKLNAAYKGIDRECAKKSVDLLAVSKLEESIKNLKKQIYELEEQKPKLKRYTIQKLTIEKLILILEENTEGVMLEIDELSSLFIRLSKDENSEERCLYLSGYNGNIPYSYDTVKRGTVLIPNLLLSILGGTQPAKLKRFINEAKNGHQDDGLLQRFQGVVFPDRTLMLPVDKKDNETLANFLAQIFQNLNSLPSNSTDNDITVLRFDDNAQMIFDEWREETTSLAHKLSYPFDAHVGKSYEFIAALSAYFYLYENNGNLTDDKCLSKKNILSAIKLGRYFLSHAKRMYGLAYQDDMPARSLSKKLARLSLPQNINDHYDATLKTHFFTRSQIRIKDWANLNTKEQRLEAIEILIKRGHISRQLNGRYYINPEHLKD